ncbi:TPA: hypothetical protein LAM98_004222 [Escherichia coli]|nr:hypothetical protein [Escherichia coli]HBJ1222274.1 hypothetical protein [Escherichia coli]HBJ1428720.1 hypothetical protein [Escherichia coli]
MAANTPQQHVQAVKKAEDEAKQQQNTQNTQDTQKTQECTIIVSGMRKGGPNEHILENADVEHIYLYFDAIPNYSYTRTVEKTQFATENRVEYSDHAVIKDKQFTLTAYINTSPTVIRKGNKIDQDTDPQNPASSMRPAKAMELLERLVDERQIISLATEEMGLLENMIITKVTAKRETSEGAALVVDLEFQEFRTFELYKTKDAAITADPKKTGTKNKGAVQSSSKSAANPDKLKNEQTVVKKTEGLATGGTRVDTPNGSTWYDEDGNYIGHKGGWYKPNVGLEINK